MKDRLGMLSTLSHFAFRQRVVGSGMFVPDVCNNSMPALGLKQQQQQQQQKVIPQTVSHYCLKQLFTDTYSNEYTNPKQPFTDNYNNEYTNPEQLFTDNYNN